jgi:hypothetical protein
MDAIGFRSITAAPSIVIIVFFLLFAADVKISSADELDDLVQDITFNLGPSPTNMNLVGVSKDFFLDGNTAVFATAGFSNMYLGGGIIYYTNGYRKDGLVYSAALGLLPEITAHATAGFQLKVERKHFATAGVGIKTTAGGSVGGTLVLAYEYKF